MNDSQTADRTIFELLGAAHALEARVESVLGDAGLSGAKFALLGELVAAGEPLPLGELATRLSCVRSNMTQLVDRLESEGLVQRVSCPTDRRSVKAEITYLGRERQAAGAAAVARLHQELHSRIGDADRAAVARMLDALK